MSLQPRPRFAALALGAALALLQQNAASATTPLVTDPAGDANVAAYPCLRSTGTLPDPCPTSVPQLSEPAIDIVEGDVVRDGTDLLYRIKVVDIDGAAVAYEAGREFSFQTQYEGVTISLRVGQVGRYDTTATGRFDVVDVASTEPGELVDVTLDATTNVLEAQVPLSVANDALAAVCATCSPIGSGSTFLSFHVGAAYETHPDGAVGTSCLARCDRGRYLGSYTLS